MLCTGQLWLYFKLSASVRAEFGGFKILYWTGDFDEELSFGNEFISREIVLTTPSTAVYNNFLYSYLSEIPFLLLRRLVHQK